LSKHKPKELFSETERKRIYLEVSSAIRENNTPAEAEKRLGKDRNAVIVFRSLSQKGLNLSDIKDICQTLGDKDGKKNDLLLSYVEISAAIEYGDSLGEVKNKLGRENFLIFRRLLQKGFTVDEIKDITEDQSREMAILDHIGSKGRLTGEIVAKLGFRLVREKAFPISDKHKYLIRMEAEGIIYPSALKQCRKLLSPKYSYLINTSNAAANENSTTTGEIMKLLFDQDRKPGQQAKNLSRLRILRNKLSYIKSYRPNSKYTKKDYNLYWSEDWRNYFAKMKRFKGLENRLKSALIENSIPPDVVKSMNVYDFQDLMFRALRKPGKNYAVLFPSPTREMLKIRMTYPENIRAVENYMKIKNYSPQEIAEKLKEMSEDGVGGNLFQFHHRTGVKNAGILTDYDKPNDPDNICILSPEIHYIVHHLDELDEKTNRYKKIEVPRKDFILSVTDLLRTDFHKEACQTRQNGVDIPAEPEKRPLNHVPYPKIDFRQYYASSKHY
jgi:DNA-binding transcriptional MerR regulator